MMGDRSWELPWDDDDDEEQAGVEERSVFDAFDSYHSFEPTNDPDQSSDPSPPHERDDHVQTLLFTATNPAETVSVTTLMDGRILRAELSPQVTSGMTETQLANEITTISTLARKQALACQHVLAADLMRWQGQDPASTRSFLERELHLPSPETVHAEQARLFASYYDRDHERLTD